jgi:hypothetical protein
VHIFVSNGSQDPDTPATTAKPLRPSLRGKRGTKSVSECDHSSGYGGSYGDKDSGSGSGDGDSDRDNVADSEPDMEESTRRRNAMHELTPAAAAKPRHAQAPTLRHASEGPCHDASYEGVPTGMAMLLLPCSSFS